MSAELDVQIPLLHNQPVIEGLDVPVEGFHHLQVVDEGVGVAVGIRGELAQLGFGPHPGLKVVDFFFFSLFQSMELLSLHVEVHLGLAQPFNLVLHNLWICGFYIFCNLSACQELLLERCLTRHAKIVAYHLHFYSPLIIYFQSTE